MSNKFLGRYGNSDFAKIMASGRTISQDEVDLPKANVIFHRFVILDVISDTNTLFFGNDPDFEIKRSYWDSIGVSNIELARVLPRNTIIGKRIYDANASSVENPMFLFPFFSHLALPCKPGEHVWVMFESFQGQELGYWMSKIVEVKHVDDVNHSHPPRAYESSFFPDAQGIDKVAPNYDFRVGRSIKTNQGMKTSIDTSIIDTDDELFYEKLLTESDASQLMTYEAVPRFKKRPGDVVLEGSNNSLIVLGTDRVGAYAESVASENKRGKIPKKTADLDGNAGSIDIVTGRGQTERTGGKAVKSKTISDRSEFKSELGKSEGEIKKDEGDPDWVNDKSRVLVSQRTKVDTNLQISNINQGFGVSDSENGDASVLMKSDKIRVLGRKDAQILVKDDAGSDVTTVLARSDGHILIKAKNSSITIDSGGKVTVDATADFAVKTPQAMDVQADKLIYMTTFGEISIGAAGEVRLKGNPVLIGNSPDAGLPCARYSDPVALGPSALNFMAAVLQTLQGIQAQCALATPPIPITLPPALFSNLPTPGNAHGIIAAGSTNVRVS